RFREFKYQLIGVATTASLVMLPAIALAEGKKPNGLPDGAVIAAQVRADAPDGQKIRDQVLQNIRDARRFPNGEPKGNGQEDGQHGSNGKGTQSGSGGSDGSGAKPSEPNTVPSSA